MLGWWRVLVVYWRMRWWALVVRMRLRACVSGLVAEWWLMSCVVGLRRVRSGRVRCVGAVVLLRVSLVSHLVRLTSTAPRSHSGAAGSLHRSWSSWHSRLCSVGVGGGRDGGRGWVRGQRGREVDRHGGAVRAGSVTPALHVDTLATNGRVNKTQGMRRRQPTNQ